MQILLLISKELTLSEATTFEGLVREAFIEPLRSVLIVDDQYPTWEEIFNLNLIGSAHSESLKNSSEKKKWHEPATANEVSGLIKEFRNQKPGFVIDIHDGVSGESKSVSCAGESPAELADHLHQSDLLVLDYNLEGINPGTGGDTARKILASVLKNQHFNLVVIHTSEDLEDTIYECLRSLMVRRSTSFDENCKANIDKIEDQIMEGEDEGDFDRSDIYEKLDMASYINARKSEDCFNKAFGDFMASRGGFSNLSSWADSLNLSMSEKKSFFYWSIDTFEKKYSNEFSETSFDGLSWSISDDCKWLRTSRGFVCFVKKGPENLIAELERAIVDWRPTPSRLISAKYRHEMSRMGAEVEDTSLRQKHAFAKFYDTIRNPGDSNLPPSQISLLRRLKLKDHVARQSEMLSFLVEDNVADFGQKIFDTDESEGSVFHSYYGVELERDSEHQKAISEYNRYVCCLPSKKNAFGVLKPEQLDSGHIFRLDGSWWVCATPACDLQPGQNTIAFKKGADESLRPFTALRLYEVKNLEALTDRHINSGSYCYIESGGEIVGLGLKSPKDDSKNPAVQKVDWRAFVALRGGMIEEGKLPILELCLELDGMNMKSENKDAEVVAKLRYEYALNYIQRIGTSVSRIGLEYVSSPKTTV